MHDLDEATKKLDNLQASRDTYVVSTFLCPKDEMHKVATCLHYLDITIKDEEDNYKINEYKNTQQIRDGKQRTARKQKDGLSLVGSK